MVAHRKLTMDEPTDRLLTEADVADLQRRLALAELFSDLRASGSGSYELLLLRLNHTVVRMRHENNHARAHFHIEYKREFSASYAVDNLARLAGSLPKRYELPVLDWAKCNQTALQATWEKLRVGEDVRELVLVKERV
jgi:hypothetical protein